MPAVPRTTEASAGACHCQARCAKVAASASLRGGRGEQVHFKSPAYMQLGDVSDSGKYRAPLDPPPAREQYDDDQNSPPGASRRRWCRPPCMRASWSGAGRTAATWGGVSEGREGGGGGSRSLALTRTKLRFLNGVVSCNRSFALMSAHARGLPSRRQCL